MASIGAQAIWIFVTWLFWIVGAGFLNSAASSFLVHGGMCGPGGVVYCSQIRGLFGALHSTHTHTHLYYPAIEHLFFFFFLFFRSGVAVVERCIISPLCVFEKCQID